MKIFISHSSRDKWAARRISDDLRKLGVTTFLDEKDIETGESVDEAVTKHLRECDELCVLLSPAAINSQWVLVEVGGAKALGKRLVPILLYVGTNEIPQPISKHLARDINDIEKYYEEVKQRLKGHLTASPQPRPTRPPKPKLQTFAPGDRVRIVDVRTLTEYDKNREPKWIPAMDRFSGRQATISYIDYEGDAFLDVDNEVFGWAPRWLTRAM